MSRQPVLVVCISLYLTFHLVAQSLSETELRTFEAVDDAADKLEKLDTALKAFEEGKVPEGLGKWNTVADNFRSAARAVKKISVSPPSSYAPTMGDPCIYITLATGLAQEYQKSNSALDSAMLRVRRHLTVARQLSPKLDEISNLFERLGSLPEFGHYFLWGWFDIEVDVKEGLNDYISSLEDKFRELNIQSDQYSARLANLQSNIGLLQEACKKNSDELAKQIAAVDKAHQDSLRAESERQQALEKQRQHELEEQRRLAREHEREEHARKEKERKEKAIFCAQHGCKAKVNIAGRWTATPGGHVFTVTQNGDEVFFSGPSHWGTDGHGRFRDDYSFGMLWPKLSKAFDGDVSADGKSIAWSNKVTWKR
jgi:hypothetical protein